MAEWAHKIFVDVGNAYGNPARVAIGKVTVDRRTSLGVQVHPDAPHGGDLPDFTLDAVSGKDLIDRIAQELGIRQ